MKLKEFYNKITEELISSDIDDSSFESGVILCEALGFSFTDLHLKSDYELSENQICKTLEMVKRRKSREPLQYIIGSWEFMGRKFNVGPGVLIPRPETELLCEKIIKRIRKEKDTVVFDLCSGSGCIGLTLKKELPEIDVYLVEQSLDALKYLHKNATTICKNTFLTIVKGDVLDFDTFELYPEIDVLVSNPPYIRSGDIPLLQKEVGFEPEMALDGGEDGLVFYRYIISNWSQKLSEKGEMFFEIGEDQADDVVRMFDEIGFYSKVFKDYSGHNRIVTGRRTPYES